MHNAIQITPPRVAFLDQRTGTISREWYLFFLSLFDLAGGGDPTSTLPEVDQRSRSNEVLIWLSTQ